MTSDLLNALQARMPAVDLLTVLAEYTGTTTTPYYAAVAGRLLPSIDVLWTGFGVVSPTIATSQAAAIDAVLGRRVILWDNFPVNDYSGSAGAERRLNLGPFEGLDDDLFTAVQGVVANVQSPWATNTVSLATLADFLNHPGRYDPESSWREALADEGGADVVALTKLAENSRSSLIDPTESIVVGPLLERVRVALIDGRRDLDGERQLRTELQAEIDAAHVLRASANRELAVGAARWIDVLEQNADAALAALDLAVASMPAVRLTPLARAGHTTLLAGHVDPADAVVAQAALDRLQPLDTARRRAVAVTHGDRARPSRVGRPRQPDRPLRRRGAAPATGERRHTGGPARRSAGRAGLHGAGRRGDDRGRARSRSVRRPHPRRVLTTDRISAVRVGGRGRRTVEWAAMTYCLAIRLDEGLVFLADTRTNAGIDNVSTYRKLHVLRPAPGSGLRARVGRQPGDHPGGARPHRARPRPARRAREPGHGRPPVRGRAVRRSARAGASAERTGRRWPRSGADGTATFILGGQIGDEPPDILLVYPEGNYIRASDDRPFLQIGESKYGKFMLELAVQAPRRPDDRDQDRPRLDDEHGPGQPLGRSALRHRRAAATTTLATCSSSASTADSPLLARLEEVWERHLLNAVADLPPISRADVEVAPATD